MFKFIAYFYIQLQNMDATRKAYLELHIAVLLFGLTAILGDLISLSAIVLVWWRVLITSISLLFLINFGKKLLKIPRKLVLQFMGIGILVGLHWICFFGSVKYSNASICLVCMATTSFFTAFLEPFILKQKIKWYEIALGLFIIPGMMLVVNSTGWDMIMGIIVGLMSAFLAALFATLNKKLVEEAEPMSITFLELGSACLFISVLLPFYFQNTPEAAFLPNAQDIGYLIILALLCTTLAYVLALRALKELSAFAANLTINLEPVYGIFLAYFFLNDSHELNTTFYVGCLMILLAVLGYPLIKKRLGVN